METQSCKKRLLAVDGLDFSVEAGETADGGGIETEAEAAQEFAGGKAVAGRRAA